LTTKKTTRVYLVLNCPLNKGFWSPSFLCPSLFNRFSLFLL